MHSSLTRSRNWTRLLGASALPVTIAVLMCGTTPAMAQGWSWPWEQQQQFRPPPAPVPPAPMFRPQPGQQPPPLVAPGTGGGYSTGSRSAICLQLEQRLAQESTKGTQSRDAMPKLEQELKVLDRQLRPAEAQLENNCYEFFLFSKALKQTRACYDLRAQVDGLRRRLAEIEAQRQQISGSAGRSYQDDIVRELAANNCGASYQNAARQQNPFNSIWQDGESSSGGGSGQFGNLPFATYRTLCVRLCDGYYFPVSFSTLPNHFERDDEACRSRCAAPVELYYHQNPGGAVEQMVSHRSRLPYTNLKSAFRYRKEFVQGCSCKQAEYVPSAVTPERRAETPAPRQ